jgi:hypothetical protein
MSAEQELRAVVDADETGGELSELRDPPKGARGKILRENLATGFCVAVFVLGGVVCLAINLRWL